MMIKSFVSFGLLLLITTTLFAQADITEKEIKGHIGFLASDKNKGRFPGTRETESVIKYIKRDFRKSGLEPVMDTYLQSFEARLRVKKGVLDTPVVKAYNVIGLIKGSDPVLSKEYIVIGAHYDHLGMGGISSKKPDTTAIHHGADDNASGVASLLEIAEKLSANKAGLKRSVLFVAFGSEEQGLLGSRYFIENPPVPFAQIKLMINMDMVGRLNKEGQVYVGGAGTFPGGVELMNGLGKELNLSPVVHKGGVGGSDHVSFYKKGISVMGIHTGGHPQYHTPEDMPNLINLPGQKMVSEFIYKALLSKANSDEQIIFIQQD